MRKEWIESTLGEIASWQGGITPSMANRGFWEDGHVPWISSGDVSELSSHGTQKFVTQLSLDETSLKLLPIGTVVVVVRSGILAHTLPVSILDVPSTINQDIKAGIPRPNILGRFLLCILQSRSQEILDSCRKTGTTVQSISTDALLNMPVAVPPLHEQKRIVDLVASVDAYIASLEQVANTARTARNAVLLELLSAGGDDWTETTLGDVAEYVNGFPFKPEHLGETGTPVIRIKQLLDPMESVDRTTIEVPDRCTLSDGDVVFSWSGTLAVRIWRRGRAYLNQHLFRVLPGPNIEKNFLSLVLDHAIDELVEKSHGTTMKHITKQTLLPHEVHLPPLTEQQRIVEVVSSMDEVIHFTELALANANLLRSGLLSDLLSGNREIPNSYDRLLGTA